MEGTVLNFERDEDRGVIRAEDGKRYGFAPADWKSAGAPGLGDIVDFEPIDARATEILVVKSAGAVANPSGGAGPAPRSASSPGGGGSHGARFFIAYFLVMIPTYVLPYFGSNSALVGMLSAGAGAGLPPLYVWHLTCIMVLAALAYVRGIRIERAWLVAFPLIGGVFDLVAGLNFVPFVPSVMHAAALYVGASRRAAEGFDRASVQPRAKVAYAILAAYALWASYNCATSPWVERSHAIAFAILPLAVLAVSALLALRIHKGLSDEAGSVWASVVDGSVVQLFDGSKPAEQLTPGADPPVQAEVQDLNHACRVCGTPNDPCARFCAECGAALASTG